MARPSFSLFDTALGPCALVWGERGLVGVLLPEAHAAATRARAQRRINGAHEADAPPEVRQVMARIVGLLRGEADSLQDIKLDTSAVPPFNLRVYELARGILPGQTLSYGEVAARLGDPLLARAVGQALGANPFPIIVPCHRVLAAGGKSGGFSAPGGARTKLRLLEIEGAALGAGPGLFDRA
ncbi:MAG: methylated-DNA--[protein]-cysteine S-methyltransferase [Burkholderiales bacterium]